jgi:hypothetical protein
MSISGKRGSQQILIKNIHEKGKINCPSGILQEQKVLLSQDKKNYRETGRVGDECVQLLTKDSLMKSEKLQDGQDDV